MPVPVLPILLASLLDPDRDTVRLVCPPVGKLGQNLARELDQGLGQTFAACGFRGCHEPANGVPSALADVKAEDCTTVVSIIAGPLAAPSPASSAASLRLPLAALEKRGCAETEHVRALLASPARRILLVTPQSLLFSRRLFERDLRKDLLADNLVEASISLPAGLIPFKVTSCSLLVLDKTRREQHDYGVHFLDAGALDTGRLASLWDDGNLEGLRTLVRSSLSLDQAGCVTEDARTLLKEESSLLATAHCLSEEARQVREYLKTRLTAPLGALVNFFRPLLADKEDKGEEVHVLNQGDLQGVGYTRPCGGSTMRTERQGKMDPLLQPGDIVLAIRGTLGKVGMLPPDWQDEELWVANQSCLVLRPARRDVDARLVYLYLRSAIGQAALQSLDCGASTPLVQLSDLKKMPVPVPSPEEAQAMLADFEKELALCARMEELRKEVDLLAGSHWSLNK